MIDRIDFRVGKKKLSIVLANKLSPQIYKTNSINLLIGKNGSGKTQTIKAIISKLVEAWPSSDTDIEIYGDTSNLAVVYYTAVPFYNPIRIYKASNVGFKDASNSTTTSQSFGVFLEEYVAASEIIGTDDALKSIRTFNPSKTTERMAEALIDTGAINYINRPAIDAFRLEKLKEELESLEKEKNGLYKKELRERSEIRVSEDLKRIESSIKQLTSEIKWSIRGIARDILNSIPQNLWVPICSYIDSIRPNLNALAEISVEILENPNEHFNWRSHEFIETFFAFVSAVENSGSGKLSIDEPTCTLVVDLGKLIKNIDPELIARAHSIGLIKITFEHVSSGQAAIFHQIINISSAINALEKSGKKDFLIFIDEGDILLHLEWQRKYIEMIDKRLGYLRNKLALNSVQLVIATHSPLLASDILKGSITTLGKHANIPAFGAPLQRIVNYSFGTPSIGSIAEKTITRLSKSRPKSETCRELIDQIDDEYIKHQLLSVGKKNDS